MELEIPDAWQPSMAEGAPVFLLVNPVEYHGPHLSLRNDHWISLGLARDLHAALARRHPRWPFLITPDLDLGVDPVPGPGSQPWPFDRAKAAVRRACAELLDRGARRVILMTFHGSPLHALALEAGAKLLRERGAQAFSPLNLVLHTMLELEPGAYRAAFADIADPSERARCEAELPFDFHAGFFETSVALHYAPRTVQPIYRALPPCPGLIGGSAMAGAAQLMAAFGARRLSRELAFAAAGMAWYGLRPFPGYTGRPALASARAGAVFAREMISLYAAAAEAIFERGARSPRPIMRWMGPASLNGRMGAPRIPIEAMLQVTGGSA